MLFGFFPSSNPIFLVKGRKFILRLLTIESPFWHWSCNPTHISGAPFNQCLIVYVFLEHTSLYHLIWQMLSPCSLNGGNPSFGNLGELPLSSPDTSLSSPWFNGELLLQKPAPIVHFPRSLQCHFNDLCCAFSSRTSWVSGILTPIGSESRSDMMVGTTFQESWCWSFDDPVTWCHA